jgi:methyl-accepting chemotaxis protein PixJ
MNSEQSLDSSKLNLATPKSTNPVQSFLQKNLITTIVISTCINLGLTGAATWSVWNTSQQLETTVSRQDRQQELNSKVIYLDELLTMSARMYTTTGQAMWEKRYTDAVPVYDKAFAELTKGLTQSKTLEAASKKLFDIEDVAFKLAKQGKLAAASPLLLGAEYQDNKQIYAREVGNLVSGIRIAAEREVRANRQALSDSILLEILSLGLLIATGALVVFTVKDYIRDREQAQKSLQVFQTDLLELNTELNQESQLRTVQQEKIVQESDTLQTDIGHILDVVSLIEDGNLTVQANVNDRSTGLISLENS